MKYKVDRYQTTFAMGSGEKGATVAKLLEKQTARVAKLLGKSGSQHMQMVTLRAALRTMAQADDKAIVLDGDE